MKKRKKIETNTSKKPMKRLIALWVVFVMLIVPFANHVGKNDVKAEGGETAVSGAGTKTAGVDYVPVQPKNLKLEIDDNDTNTNNLKKKDDVETYTLLKGKQEVWNIYRPTVSRESNLPENSEIKFEYIIYDKDADVEDTAPDSATTVDTVDTLQDNEALTSSNKKIAYYAYIGSKDDGVESRLQCVVNIKFVDTMFSVSDGIYQDDTKLSDGAIVTDAKLKAGISEAADIRYYVTDTAASDGDKMLESKYNSSDALTASDVLTKKYAYAGYFYKDSLLEYKELGSVTLVLDTKEPTVACRKIEEQNSDGSYSAIDEKYKDADSNIYYGNSEAYKYTVTIEDVAGDGEGASGVDASTVSAKLDNTDLTVTPVSGENNTYEITVPENTLSTTEAKKVVVTAKDCVGNEAAEVCLVKIQQVDPAYTKTTVRFTDDPNTDLVETPVNINGYKTVHVEYEFVGDGGYTDASIVDSEGKSYEITKDEFASKLSVKRTNTWTLEFKVPAADTTNSTTIEKCTVSYKDGSSDETLEIPIKKILYDTAAPTMSAPKIERSTDGGFAAPAEVGADSAEIYYTEPDVPYYRYVLTVTDDTDGSGVKEVYAKVGETKIPFTQVIGTNKYVYDCTENLSSTTSFALTVYAEDLAGNTSEGLQLRPIQKVDTGLKVSYEIISKNTGTALTSAETTALFSKKYTNQKYQLKITATSAYKIDNITMYSSAGTKTGNVIGNNDAEKNANRYSASATFDIPDGDVNEFFENLYFVVKDHRAQELNYPGNADGIQHYLGSILYDHTVPVLTGVNDAGDKWYKTYTLNYKLSSGNETPESPLTIAAYAVSNGKESPQEDRANGTDTSFSGSIVISESQSEQGTKVTFTAKDACLNEMTPVAYTVKVDQTKPEIDFDVNGKKIVPDPIEGDVVIKANVSDNLTIQTATIRVQGPNTDVTKSICDAGNAKQNTFTLENLIGKKAEDGEYTATVNVADKAGNSASQTITFKVDNTMPVVTAKISDGVTAGKQPGKNFDGTDCDYFYRSNVTALLTYEDDNLAQSKVVVKDNGTTVPVQWSRVGTTNKYQATYVASKEGAHTITIGATDEAGNAAVTKQIVFIKDTAAPAITAVINGGMVYNENMGVVDLTANANVSFSVSDSNEDVKDFNYQLIKTEPDQLPVTADVIQTETRGFGYVDEADYIVKVYAIDKAGNKSAERTVQFRVDKTAPELKVSGASSGATLNSGTTLTFSMTEAFWKDASGTVTITRKPKDGAQESTYKTIDFKPTARTTTMTETLSETGEYKVTFTGKDRAGHSAEAASYTVKIDTGKPVIALSGVKNNDKTTDAVEFTAQIDEDFYLTKSVSIKATRTYLDKTSYQEKTEDLQITGYNPAAATTLIRNTFTEDGIYKIQIGCKDAAGNTDTQEVSFTIDKTKPVIDAKVLAAYAGKLTAFSWDYDLDDIIYDLTVCDVHMYLNGTEYDGTSEVEDGAYELKIVAEDELGNQTEETSNFSLDTKAPTFIVTGVEDGEVKNEQYDINVSLQLEEDTLDSVSLNGKAIEIKDDAASITVTEKGDYKLTMKAHDEAGNEAEKTISFTYGEKKSVVLYVVIGVAALAVLGGGGAALIIGLRKKKA